MSYTDLQDFIDTAIEQGIGYWAAEVQQFESHISGVDCEDPDTTWSFTILELIAVIGADPRLKELFEEGQYDCEDADIAFQKAAFGEIVYG